MDLKGSAIAFLRRHRTGLILAASVAAALLADHFLAGGALRGLAARLWTAIRARFYAVTDPEPWLALAGLTLFLAFANLYLKIALQAPNLQRRLRPAVFVNLPFAIYCSVYPPVALKT